MQKLFRLAVSAAALVFVSTGVRWPRMRRRAGGHDHRAGSDRAAGRNDTLERREVS
jgi:hypothetical protein